MSEAIVGRFYEIKFPTTEEGAMRIAGAISRAWNCPKLIVAYHTPDGDTRKILVEHNV